MTESVLLWIVILLESGQPPRPSFKAEGFIHERDCIDRGREILLDLTLFDRTAFKVYCTRHNVFYSVDIAVNE